MKNVSLKVMALVLAILMITVCFASTTVSYYESKYSNDEFKTVAAAAWGLSFNDLSTISMDDLFSNPVKIDNIPVASSAVGEFIVCPGVSSSGTLSIDLPEGAPEVNYEISITISLETNVTSFEISKNGTEFSDEVTFTKQASAGTSPATLFSDLTLYYQWLKGDGAEDNADSDDVEFAGADIVFSISVTAKQIFTAPTN